MENALRDFRLAGVDLPAERKSPLPRSGAAARAARHQILGERPRCRARLLRAASTDESELARTAADRASIGPPPMRARPNRPGWLFKLDQPTYMTVMTSAESGHLRRDIYEAWVTRASELGPVRGPLRQQPDHRRDPAAAPRACAAPGISRTSPTMRLATRMAKSSKQVLGVPGRSGAALPPGGAARVLGSRGIRGAQARGLGPRVLRRAAAGEPLQGVAGGAAPLLPASQGAVRAVRGDRAAVRHHGPRAARRQRLASERALLRSRRRDGRIVARLLSRSLFARREAQRRVDGRVRRSRSRSPRAGPPGRAIWCAISPRRSAPRPRC